MKSKVVRHIIYSLIFTFLNGFLAFYINRVFGDNLGQGNLGILKLFTQLVAYLNLSELGVSAASAAILYKLFNENNYIKIKDVFKTIDFFYSRIAAGIFFLGLILLVFIPSLVSEPCNNIYFIWCLYVVATSSSYLYAKYVIIFSSDQNYEYVQLVKNSVKISIQILQIISLKYFQSFEIFVCLLVFGNFFEYIFYYIFFKANYKLKLSNYKASINDNYLIKSTKQVFVHKIAGVLVLNTDYIVIAKFIGIKTVAIYSSYIMVYQFINLFLSNVILVIKPKIGLLVGKSSKDEVKKIWDIMYIISFFVASNIIFVFFVNINFFINLWMGNDYLLSQLTVLLITINVFIEIIRKPIDIIKDVSGYFKDIHLPIIEGLFNLITSIILAIYIGLNGVIIGTLISNILIILLMKPYVVYKDIFHFSFFDYIFRTVKYIMMSIIVFYISWNIIGYLAINDLIMFIISPFISLLVSMVIFYFDIMSVIKLRKIND
ncbi:hypothetical protein VXS03_14490 [Photobacterium sp. S4TG1]|uniref:lipopolysaccharide biosynthesis protein n=1 Tax=Photobacterium sp. S4TG1 TaxID=3114587 RepID=UPI002E19ACAA|nr:hypothetical protein [Photobacterium sp. S4TG1]